MSDAATLSIATLALIAIDVVLLVWVAIELFRRK